VQRRRLLQQRSLTALPTGVNGEITLHAPGVELTAAVVSAQIYVLLALSANAVLAGLGRFAAVSLPSINSTILVRRQHVELILAFSSGSAT